MGMQLHLFIFREVTESTPQDSDVLWVVGQKSSQTAQIPGCAFTSAPLAPSNQGKILYLSLWNNNCVIILALAFLPFKVV